MVARLKAMASPSRALMQVLRLAALFALVFTANAAASPKAELVPLTFAEDGVSACALRARLLASQRAFV